jgi:hypothetical protein
MRSRALTVFVLLLLFVAFFPEQAGQAAQSIVAALLNALLELLTGVAVVADFHRVKTPTPLEFPPPTVRPAAQPTAWDWLLLYVGRPLWGFRVELAAALLVLAIWQWLADPLGCLPGLLVLGAC